MSQFREISVMEQQVMLLYLKNVHGLEAGNVRFAELRENPERFVEEYDLMPGQLERVTRGLGPCSEEENILIFAIDQLTMCNAHTIANGEGGIEYLKPFTDHTIRDIVGGPRTAIERAIDCHRIVDSPGYGLLDKEITCSPDGFLNADPRNRYRVVRVGCVGEKTASIVWLRRVDEAVEEPDIPVVLRNLCGYCGETVTHWKALKFVLCPDCKVVKYCGEEKGRDCRAQHHEYHHSTDCGRMHEELTSGRSVIIDYDF